MRVVNIVANLKIQPKLQNGCLMVEKGQIKIFGADDSTVSLLLTEFPELKYNRSTTALATSAPVPSTSSSGGNNDDGRRFLFTCQEEESMELDQAIAQITRYLNVLDQQEFTVVSAFKDEILDASASTNDHYKVYVWTMQK